MVFAHLFLRRALIVLGAVFIIATPPVSAATAVFAGLARVYDGDTIRVEGRSVRIWGIDAVERKQTCRLEGRDLPCGELARAAMERIIGNNDVICAPRGTSYKRVVALCTAGGVDIGREMVRLGMAFESARYSRGLYTDDERAARAENIGLWAMQVQKPALWRKCNQPRHKGQRPAACDS